MALHEPGSFSNEKDTNRCRRSTTAMDEISKRMVSSLDKKIPYLIANRDKIPPWGLYLAYKTYVVYMQKRQDNDELDVSDKLRLLKKVLSVANGRWKVAGSYLKLIEAREVIDLNPIEDEPFRG
jgi:hypothetical protein